MPVSWLIAPSLSSIIAVHGLNGDATNTWKHPKNNHFWLQDSLPLDVKGARILSYGYNADVAFGNTTANVWDHAKSLLGSLIDEREPDDVRHYYTISCKRNFDPRTLHGTSLILILSMM